MSSHETREIASPDSNPVRAITNFSGALSCMDDLMARSGVKGVSIAIDDIADKTDQLKAGITEMTVSALSSISAKSGAITTFATRNPNRDGRDGLKELHAMHDSATQRAPDFFLRGAVTQLDRSVVRNQVGAGIDVGLFNISGLKAIEVDMVTLDLNVGLVRDLSMIAGVSARNSVAVASRTQSGQAGAVIKTVGLTFRMNLNKSDGPHQAVRTLVELAVVEIVGKMTGLPYWTCLDDPATDPVFRANRLKEWKGKNKPARVRDISHMLRRQNAYKGPINGVLTAQLREAIAGYESRRGLIPDGQPDFDLFLSLASQRAARDRFGTGQTGTHRAAFEKSVVGREIRRRGNYPSSLKKIEAMREIELIVYAQDLLKRLNYRKGPSDGVMDQTMVRQIVTYQRDNRIPETGVLTPKLVAAMAVRTAERRERDVALPPPRERRRGHQGCTGRFC